MSQHLPNLSPSRRTLLRTTAWSVPAVSLAAAAPAFATSGAVAGSLMLVWGPTAEERAQMLEDGAASPIGGFVGQFDAIIGAPWEAHQLLGTFTVQSSTGDVADARGLVVPPYESVEYMVLAPESEALFRPVESSGVVPSGGLEFVASVAVNYNGTVVWTLWTPPAGEGRNPAAWTFMVTPSNDATMHPVVPVTLTQMWGSLGE